MAGGCAWQGVCMAGGGVQGKGHAWWEALHGRARMLPGGYDEIRSMSGRYASYWNAFLLFDVQNIFCVQIKCLSIILTRQVLPKEGTPTVTNLFHGGVVIFKRSVLHLRQARQQNIITCSHQTVYVVALIKLCSQYFVQVLEIKQENKVVENQ